MNKIVSRT